MTPGVFFFFQLLSILLSPSTRPEVSDMPFPNDQQSAALIYLQLSCPEMNPNAFLLAFEGYSQIKKQNLLRRDTILTIIDFSKPSTEERIFIVDMKNNRLVKKSLVAHGKGSGTLYAQSFSNIPHSLQSSLGFYITANTYQGKHGYSLRINGIEPGINNNAWQRAIVIHGAYYASPEFIKTYGRLGRSFGCPALPYADNCKIIDLIKDASCLFIYSPEQAYLKTSCLVNSSYYSQITPE